VFHLPVGSHLCLVPRAGFVPTPCVPQQLGRRGAAVVGAVLSLRALSEVHFTPPSRELAAEVARHRAQRRALMAPPR